MTKKELNKRTDEELTPSENALINFNIYHNPDHIEYYQKFHMGDYQGCYDYLMNNRHLLTLEYTPEETKHLAEQAIRLAKFYYGS